MQNLIDAFNQFAERFADSVRSLKRCLFALVARVERFLVGRGMAGRGVRLAAVLIAVAIITGCEAGGQFDYSCNTAGFCTGEYPVPEK